MKAVEETVQKNVSDVDSYLDLENLSSMDELLKETEKARFVPGVVITGTIVEKRDDCALIDIGYKAEGTIDAVEFKDWDNVKKGDKIDVFLEEIENENNMPALSLEKAYFLKAWENILNNYKEGDIIKGIMKNKVKGGLIVDIQGVDSFLPGSQVDVVPVKNIDEMLGKEYEFKILKINKERKNIVISRRELIEEQHKNQKKQVLDSMEVGQIRKGIVKNITDFGAFIDMGGIDGLLHVTDLSWGRVSHPSEVLSVGQEIEVKILEIDYEKERVSLGLKQKTENPWEKIEEKYPVGSRVTGKVVNLMPYGAFVEIEDGVEGLIHISEMSWTKKINKPSEMLKMGEHVEAVVLDIQKENRKISLGLRQKEENPWERLAKNYPVGSKIKGTVRNMTSYGAFVKIEGDIDGMIHISDMSWTRKISHPNEMLKLGEEVEAVILDTDVENQRISLGIKQLEEDPWKKIDELYKIGDVVKGKINKITNFGMFIELSYKIDGLIHISQISEERINNIKSLYSVGDEVEARIIKIDKNERRIGLSIKAAKENISDEQLKKIESEVSRVLKPGEDMVAVGEILDDSLSSLSRIETKEDEDKNKSEASENNQSETASSQDISEPEKKDVNNEAPEKSPVSPAEDKEAK